MLDLAWTISVVRPRGLGAHRIHRICLTRAARRRASRTHVAWVQKAEGYGAIPVTDTMRADLAARTGRDWAWDQAALAVEAIDRAGCSGAVLTGLRFETVVGEAAE